MARARVLLRRLTQACASLGLVVNRNKTKAMAFRYQHLPEPFELDGVPVSGTHEHQ